MVSRHRMGNIEIRDNPDEARYEIREDGALAGFAEYRIDHGRITLRHTEIEESRSGRGLGGRLVRAALADAQRRGLAVVPVCRFVALIIRQEPDRYLDSVVPSMRGRVMDSQPLPSS
jgi:predicted GNAT family acetyltransferase